MTPALLIAVSLGIAVSFDMPKAGMSAGTNLSDTRKEAVIRPFVASANGCVAKTVRSAPPFRTASADPAEMNRLIVDSVPSCTDVLRAMIDEYDRQYGEGAGETYFMGPYLDALPEAIRLKLMEIKIKPTTPRQRRHES